MVSFGIDIYLRKQHQKFSDQVLFFYTVYDLKSFEN